MPRAREDRYKSAFKHDLTANFIARPDGTLIDCNRAFVRIFRLASRDAALACNLRALLASRAMWSNLVRQLKGHHALVRQSCDWVRSDGTVLHMVQTVVGRYDGTGTLIEVLGFLFDDTERTRAATELERHRGQLETLVEQQTAELRARFEQLRLADRMATLGTLAAGLGHDLNNVLLPVRAQLNVLLAASSREQRPRHDPPGSRDSTSPFDDPVDVRTATESIAACVAYLQHLADGLHYLTQNPDNSRPDGTALDLAEWWKRGGAVVGKAIPKHVKLSATFESDLPPVGVAPHPLTQAVLNLVVNAGEAIPPLESDPTRKRRQGRVRITAHAETHKAGRAWVVLAVSDNGTGMTPEIKRRAFELFFTTKARGSGTGLGLPLVHSVTARVGGRVEIDSEVGKGTTVTMWLPAVLTTPLAERRRHAVVSINDPRVATLVRHVLEAAGVIVVGDGEHVQVDLRVTDTIGDRTRQGVNGHRPARHSLIIPSPADFPTIRGLVGEALHRMCSPTVP